ncbi:glutathione S-transferase [Infundibulicybe gibba]|nr:glutathione S-transferase [Infundibulicybe gibba]
MVLKLHGVTTQGSPSGLVAMVLIEKKVPFELVYVDTSKGEHKTPEYLKRNPFGQVPYIDDDGFILYDSRAICRYVSMKYREQGTPLLPPAKDIKATALFEQAATIEASRFTPPVAGAIDEMFYKKLHGLEPDREKYNEHIATLSARLDVYDEILGKHKYLLGDEVSLADLLHLSGGAALGIIGSDIMSQKPNVARWFNDISSRESWQVLKDGVKSTV